MYSKVLIESGPHIFQVTYFRNILLVSNYQRSYIVKLEEDFQVLSTTIIGSKDRKQGYYGATFFEDGEGKKKIAVARPGFRIWIVSLDGIVSFSMNICSLFIYIATAVYYNKTHMTSLLERPRMACTNQSTSFPIINHTRY